MQWMLGKVEIFTGPLGVGTSIQPRLDNMDLLDNKIEAPAASNARTELRAMAARSCTRYQLRNPVSWPRSR